MTFHYSSYSISLLFATAVAIAVFLFIWKKRETPGVGYFLLLLLAIAEWSFAGAVEMAANEPPVKILWSKISYIGISSSALLLFMFMMRYTQRSTWITPLRSLYLWIVPIATLALAATNEHHGLVWPEIKPLTNEPGSVLIYGHGVIVWVIMAYSYLLLFLCTILLFQSALNAPKLYKKQSHILISAIMFPWFGSAAYLFKITPFQGIDFAPLAFTVSVLLLGFAINRYKFLNIIPVAHDKLFFNMPNGVIVTDNSDRIVDINPSACEMFNVKSNIIGSEISSSIPVIDNLPPENYLEDYRIEVSLSGKNMIWGEMLISPIMTDKDRIFGRLIIIQDITERKNQEKEREDLIEELKKAISEIKTLRGFIPICSHCKRIRTDKGYWEQIEKYIGDHSEAEFTHGICPDCMKLYYAEIAKRKEEKNKKAPSDPESAFM